MKNFTKIIVSAILIFLIVNCTLYIENCKAQWVQSNGPGGGSVNCLTISGNHIFAGTESEAYFIQQITEKAGMLLTVVYLMIIFLLLQ